MLTSVDISATQYIAVFDITATLLFCSLSVANFNKFFELLNKDAEHKSYKLPL